MQQDIKEMAAALAVQHQRITKLAKHGHFNRHLLYCIIHHPGKMISYQKFREVTSSFTPCLKLSWIIIWNKQKLADFWHFKYRSALWYSASLHYILSKFEFPCSLTWIWMWLSLSDTDPWYTLSPYFHHFNGHRRQESLLFVQLLWNPWEQ